MLRNETPNALMLSYEYDMPDGVRRTYDPDADRNLFWDLHKITLERPGRPPATWAQSLASFEVRDGIVCYRMRWWNHWHCPLEVLVPAGRLAGYTECGNMRVERLKNHASADRFDAEIVASLSAYEAGTEFAELVLDAGLTSRGDLVYVLQPGSEMRTVLEGMIGSD